MEMSVSYEFGCKALLLLLLLFTATSTSNLKPVESRAPSDSVVS